MARMLNGFRSHVRAAKASMIHTTSRGICFTRYGDRYGRITLIEGLSDIFEPSLPLSLSLSLSLVAGRLSKKFIAHGSARKNHTFPWEFPGGSKEETRSVACVRVSQKLALTRTRDEQARSRFIGARISSRNFQFSPKFAISVHGVPFIPPLARCIEN